MTKRESNLGFAHGMPTTFVFKQPSGVQAFTGTLSSISGIVAAAVPTLINVKTVPTPQKAVTLPQASVASSQATTAASPAKEKPSAPVAADLNYQTAGPSAQELQSNVDQFKKLIKFQNDQMNKNDAAIKNLRQALIDFLKAAGKTIEEINKVLKDNGLDTIPAE